jgi:hypothetical protein
VAFAIGSLRMLYGQCLELWLNLSPPPVALISNDSPRTTSEKFVHRPLSGEPRGTDPEG